MTEREIRRVIAEVCEKLDRRARALGRVVGPVVGAGLALGVAGCDRATALYSAPNPDGSLDAKAKVEGLKGDQVPPQDAAYMAPDTGPKTDMLRLDKGPPVPPYMAPDLGPPGPDYMAPDVGPPGPEYLAPFDAGVGPLYIAPPPKDAS